MRIPFISAELNIPERDVEALLVSLILDAKVAGHIDQASVPCHAPPCEPEAQTHFRHQLPQVNQLLELTDTQNSTLNKKYAGLDKSVVQLKSIYSSLVSKIQ